MRKTWRYLSLLLALTLCLSASPLAFASGEAEEAAEQEELIEEIVEVLEDESEGSDEEPPAQETEAGEAQTELPDGAQEAAEPMPATDGEADMYSGSCGKTLTWTLSDDGVMTISGTGPMTYYSDGYKVPWFSYAEHVTKVLVEDGVTTLGRYVFRDCVNLTEVSLPDTLTSIGIYAFANCPNLLEVAFPENLVSIGQEAFSGCSSLTEITLPCPTGRWAFTNCTSLEAVIILDGSTFVEEGTFSGCTSLTQVSIPSSVTEIRKSAFGGCSSLRAIDIPDSVTFFGWGVFAGSGITSIVLPDGVACIDGWMFHNCEDLRYVVIPATVTKINERAFYKCGNLTDVYFTGTKELWNAIEVLDTWDGNPPSYYGYDESFNQPLYNAKIHYNSTGPENNDNEIHGYIYNSGEQYIPLYQDFEDYFFQTPSTTYNPELAYYLCGLARAAYSADDIKKSLDSLGFSGENDVVISNLYNVSSPDAAYSISEKFLEDGRALVLITIRGTSEPLEWLSDFNMGLDTQLVTGWHVGFEQSTNRVYNDLQTFMGDVAAEGVTYVITGHSLGAAVANLLSVKLLDAGVPSANVYDYNFACPDVANGLGSRWNYNGEHDNMFNIGNSKDLVTFVPGVAGDLMGFIMPWFTWGKFGRSYWFASDWANVGQTFDVVGNHDAKTYLNYMAGRPSLNSLKTIDELNTLVFQDQIRMLLGVFCPVDVTVYNSAGDPVAGVQDGIANYYDSAVGEVLIHINGDQKVICLPAGDQYDVKLTGTDIGEMTYKVLNADIVTRDSEEEKSFDAVALETGKQMISYVDEGRENLDVSLYIVGENGGASASVQEDGSEAAIPLGDINGSGSVDAVDLIRLLKYINGQDIRLIASGDVTGDGNINLADLIRLLKYLEGYDVPLY